ncbi:MAG: CDGSH iron-sulfur domain-containing protein [Actinomycetota bacterium]|nr:CDGSH iron-sulfur domain-containing protein [Actinomycetota bacterium]
MRFPEASPSCVDAAEDAGAPVGAAEPGAGGAAAVGAVIVPYRDGPLLVRGDFTLRTPDGEVIDPGRRTVALCRCGRSALKPFCDGSHKAVGFRAPTGDARG